LCFVRITDVHCTTRFIHGYNSRTSGHGSRLNAGNI
jgi:hypothetical protein